MNKASNYRAPRRAPIALAVAAFAFSAWVYAQNPAQNSAPVKAAQNPQAPVAMANAGGSDKVDASASDPKLLKTPLGAIKAAALAPTELLTSTFFTPANKDLLIDFSGECAVYTHTSVSGGASGTPSDEAAAGVRVWIELDGQPVPVSTKANPPDDGQVGLCSRTENLTTTLSDAEYVDLFQYSKAAHAFNWAVLNVEAGMHTVRVLAQINARTTSGGDGEAAALIGKRSVNIEEVTPHESAGAGGG
ncbi:MAG: hypothetical protein E6K53_07665 [Gammaproteobacteria bacterium]|nr:MAG: hypothetical protein E6K53_07665 [Gammaproteobacteria bacterium]